MLYVSVNTLKSHVRSVYRKLAVASRADAVNVGRSNDLLDRRHRGLSKPCRGSATKHARRRLAVWNFTM